MDVAIRKALQLYSIRDTLSDSLESTLYKLAIAGFQEAECFDLILLRQIKPLLDDFHIDVNSAFLFWPHVTKNYALAGAIDYPYMPDKWGVEYEVERAHSLGLDTLVMGYMLPEERQTLDQFKRNIDLIQQAAQQCKQADIRLLYHNHAFEFQSLEGVVPYHYMLDQIDPSLLGIELDVFWSQVAGVKALDVMERYDTRVKQLHLKTGITSASPVFDDQSLTPAMQSYPLGTGIVDIENIVVKAQALGISRCFIEQEYSQRDIVDDLIQSGNYLADVLLKKTT